MKNKTIISLIITGIILLGIGFWAGTFYSQVKRSEQIRCGQFDPRNGDYDTAACLNADCRTDGRQGEWSCIPKWPL